MTMPGFSAEFSLYRTSTPYQGTECSSRQDSSLGPALNIPIGNICQRFPWLCEIAPSINVSWLSCQNGLSGFVLVTGSNFAANSLMTIDVSNCSGPFSVQTHATSDGSGSFTTWTRCDCSGTTTVNAFDSAGGSATGTAAIPC